MPSTERAPSRSTQRGWRKRGAEEGSDKVGRRQNRTSLSIYTPNRRKPPPREEQAVPARCRTAGSSPAKSANLSPGRWIKNRGPAFFHPALPNPSARLFCFLLDTSHFLPPPFLPLHPTFFSPSSLSFQSLTITFYTPKPTSIFPR